MRWYKTFLSPRQNPRISNVQVASVTLSYLVSKHLSVYMSSYDTEALLESDRHLVSLCICWITCYTGSSNMVANMEPESWGTQLYDSCGVHWDFLRGLCLWNPSQGWVQSSVQLMGGMGGGGQLSTGTKPWVRWMEQFQIQMQTRAEKYSICIDHPRWDVHW